MPKEVQKAELLFLSVIAMYIWIRSSIKSTKSVSETPMFDYEIYVGL